MHISTAITAGAALVQTAVAASVQAKNVIYIVPDGYGPASQNMARDLMSLVDSGTTGSNPKIHELAVDDLAIGRVRTHSANNMITDSAASGTAYAAGHKSYNGAISVTPEGQPVGSILEAAKLGGMKTGLVSTTYISDATPAVYAAHAANRGSMPLIAEQQLGYSHPLGPMVDLLLGGGRCNFSPNSTEGSCRADDFDLLTYAEEQGFTVATNRQEFNALEKGQGQADLPFLGLFSEGNMRYEMDRRVIQDEPSLLEMAETAVNALHRATRRRNKGFFLMIEAARIDHAGHDNDPANHASETVMYNNVVAWIRDWIDQHPDTIMLSAADHETGGLTLNGYDPLPLRNATHSRAYLQSVWDNDRPADADERDFLVSEILPAYGLEDVADADIQSILDADSIGAGIAALMSSRAGVDWSTGGHTSVDVTLHGYAAGRKRHDLKADLAGGWDNTELPRYIEEVLGLDMDAVTEKLRKAAQEDSSWLGPRQLVARRDLGGCDHYH
ncbi:alkaline-phosphatase-like protein [Aspergillus pseudocaelatus]|uniref:Alkaline phosphatase n=1 Tax=Aspergillus pseudocaelatus TaxID=1825620 RepID=A0ABQ6WL87_9EURO|nr:alkaline-phosphatase-like protein [Aspergillus pseudocaelatus]